MPTSLQLSSAELSFIEYALEHAIESIVNSYGQEERSKSPAANFRQVMVKIAPFRREYLTSKNGFELSAK